MERKINRIKVMLAEKGITKNKKDQILKNLKNWQSSAIMGFIR